MRSFSFLRFGRRLLADEVLLRLDRFDRDRCIEPPGVSMELLVEPRALLWVLRGVMVGSGGETMELDLDSDGDCSEYYKAGRTWHFSNFGISPKARKFHNPSKVGKF